MTIEIHASVDEKVLEEAKMLGKHTDTEALIQEALEAYIRGKKAVRFFDVAAETDWKEPLLKAS